MKQEGKTKTRTKQNRESATCNKAHDNTQPASGAATILGSEQTFCVGVRALSISLSPARCFWRQWCPYRQHRPGPNTRKMNPTTKITQQKTVPKQMARPKRRRGKAPKLASECTYYRVRSMLPGQSSTYCI